MPHDRMTVIIKNRNQKRHQKNTLNSWSTITMRKVILLSLFSFAYFPFRTSFWHLSINTKRPVSPFSLTCIYQLRRIKSRILYNIPKTYNILTHQTISYANFNHCYTLYLQATSISPILPTSFNSNIQLDTLHFNKSVHIQHASILTITQV